jgi:hypothetical protein
MMLHFKVRRVAESLGLVLVVLVVLISWIRT